MDEKIYSLLTQEEHDEIWSLYEKITDNANQHAFLVRNYYTKSIIVGSSTQSGSYALRFDCKDTFKAFDKYMEIKVDLMLCKYEPYTVMSPLDSSVILLHQDSSYHFNKKDLDSTLSVMKQSDSVDLDPLDVIQKEPKITRESDIPKQTKQIKQPKQLPKELRSKVWPTYQGNIYRGPCYVCQDDITSGNFEAGHVISVYNGGKHELRNLRPVCRPCNSSMGRMNMDDYARLYHPESKLLSETIPKYDIPIRHIQKKARDAT